MSGSRVDLTTADGIMDNYAFRPSSGAGPWPAAIIYMDSFGIRPNLASMAQRLADAGYVVVVPNLYYRTGPFEPFDPKKVFGGDEADRVRFRGMIDSIDNTKVRRDTEPILAWLAAAPTSSNRRSGRSATAWVAGSRSARSADFQSGW